MKRSTNQTKNKNENEKSKKIKVLDSVKRVKEDDASFVSYEVKKQFPYLSNNLCCSYKDYFVCAFNSTLSLVSREGKIADSLLVDGVIDNLCLLDSEYRRNEDSACVSEEETTLSEIGIVVVVQGAVSVYAKKEQQLRISLPGGAAVSLLSYKGIIYASSSEGRVRGWCAKTGVLVHLVNCSCLCERIEPQNNSLYLFTRESVQKYDIDTGKKRIVFSSSLRSFCVQELVSQDRCVCELYLLSSEGKLDKFRERVNDFRTKKEFIKSCLLGDANTVFLLDDRLFALYDESIKVFSTELVLVSEFVLPQVGKVLKIDTGYALVGLHGAITLINDSLVQYAELCGSLDGSRTLIYCNSAYLLRSGRIEAFKPGSTQRNKETSDACSLLNSDNAAESVRESVLHLPKGFPFRNKDVRSIATDGTKVVVGTRNGQIYVGDRQLESGTESVLLLAVHNEHVVSITRDGMFRCWKNENLLFMQCISSYTVSEMCIDSNMIFTSSSDGFLRVYSIESGVLLSSAKDSRKALCTMDAKNKVAATGGLEGIVRLYNIKLESTETQLASKREISAHYSTISCIRLSDDGSRVFSCCVDGLIKCWDGGSGRCFLVVDAAKDAIYSMCTLSSDVLCVSADGTVIELIERTEEALKESLQHREELYKAEKVKLGVVGDPIESIITCLRVGRIDECWSVVSKRNFSMRELEERITEAVLPELEKAIELWLHDSNKILDCQPLLQVLLKRRTISREKAEKMLCGVRYSLERINDYSRRIKSLDLAITLNGARRQV